MYVVVVDQTRAITESVQRVLASTGATTVAADALQELPHVFEATGQPDLLVIAPGHALDVNVAAQIRQCAYRGRILALVDNLSGPGARDLTRLGSVECVIRPTSVSSLDEVLHRAIFTAVVPPVKTTTNVTGPMPTSFHGIVGGSPKLLEIFSRIKKVATGDANVCIYGESGTGKELIARAIHYASPRRDRPLITLDCTTIPEGLMESHVLGHVKGAFTGAVEHREGVFSLAHTGTLFIDELSELGPMLQAKLLRVIQTRGFVPIGGTKPKQTDVRIITATNKDLKQEVENGRFREDLYYRVAVFMINVPPLRERREDIPALVDHMIEKLATVYGKAIAGVESRALKHLMDMPWPGNVRQLENFLEQAVVLAEADTLTELELFTNQASSGAPPASSLITYEPGLPLSEVERRHILNTLQKVGGNRTEAARQLGISVRCLQYKLKEYTADRDPTREVSS